MPYAAEGMISTDVIAGGIEITDEQYGDALNGIVTGKVVSIDGGFRVDFPPELEQPEEPALTLPEIKASLKAYVDAAAETERGKYITAGSGQAMTYLQKAAEASAYLASPDPAPNAYPLLSAEVGITAPTLGEVADVINSAFTKWQLVGAAIEAVRLSAKSAIENADTAAAAQAVAEQLTFPQPG